MNRTHWYLLGAALLVAATANAEDHRPVTILQSTAPGPLTLSEAKQIVTQSLLETGHREFRAGAAAFDDNGNVVVAVVSQEGLTFGHVLIDGHTRQVVVAKARAGMPSRG